MSEAANALKALVGKEVGVSGWHPVDQGRIDAFAEVGGDHQFIHVEPERAAAEAPFGGTIAHGFLIVSLLSAMLAEVIPAMPGRRMAVNYGFDRLRFVSPVPSGARVRGRFVVAKVKEREPGEVTVTYSATVEQDGSERPALVADWITRYYFDAAV